MHTAEITYSVKGDVITDLFVSPDRTQRDAFLRMEIEMCDAAGWEIISTDFSI